MIKNISKREEMKQIVSEQLASLYPNEVDNTTDLKLCNITEDILLWQIEYRNKIQLYFYTNRNYKMLFNGQVFPYASPFSNDCAVVKEMNTETKNKWKPDKVELKIKVMDALKEEAYNDTLYRQFLSYTYENQLPYMEIFPNENVKSSLTSQMEEDFIRELHDLYGYDSETPILNTCTNRAPVIVNTGSLEEYKRVRGRVLK